MRPAATKRVAEHLPKLRAVVNNCKDIGVLVKKSKKTVKNTTLIVGLMQICQHRFLVDSVQLREGCDCQLQKHTHFCVICSATDPCKILSYIDYRLFNSDFKVIVNCLNPQISHANYILLTKSAINFEWRKVVFNAEKDFVHDRNFKIENVRKYMMLFFKK